MSRWSCLRSPILLGICTLAEVLVTERGKPIARPVPYQAGLDPSESLHRLIKEGIVRPGQGGTPWDFIQNRPQARAQESVLSALLEERAEGR